MITPAPAFEKYLHAVHMAYGALISMPLSLASNQSIIPSNGGIYVFYEKDCPIYVGRTRNLNRRIRQHSHKNSNHFSASFAFLIARRKAALPEKTSITRAQMAKHLDSLFSLCRQRVSCMSLRWVDVEDPIVQSLLEVYAAVTLGTTEHFNSFRTT